MSVRSELITVTAEATQIDLGDEVSVPGSFILVTNRDDTFPVFLGGADVDVTTGTPLVAGGHLGIDLPPGDELWAVTVSAPVDLAVMVTGA